MDPHAASAIVHPAPAGEQASDDYTLEIDGRPVFVYRARVSAVPFNQVWPGYQRPLEQTELAAFASWDMAAPVELSITAHRPFAKVTVRPYASGLQPRVEGRTLTMTVTQPGQFVVEFDDHHHALHCFANPPEKHAPSPTDPNVRYFGPGVHEAGVIVASSGQTIHLAAGAVVHGAIEADGATNVRITGRGILDSSRFTRERFNAGEGPFGTICLHRCTHCLIEGITIRDPHAWTVIPVNCSDIEIRNIKLIGLWRYNSDGIDLVNSQRMTVRDCFVRAYDDCIVLKGMNAWGPHQAGTLPVEDIVVERCVLWNDWGRCLELGAETVAPAMRRIVFRDCDLIHTSMVAMDIQHGDRAEIADVLFERIRIEMDDGMPIPQFQNAPGEVFNGRMGDGYLPQVLVVGINGNAYTQDATRGRVSDVRFRDIRVTANGISGSHLHGADAEHRVRDVSIETLVINGTPIDTLAAGRIDVGPFVDGVSLRP